MKRNNGYSLAEVLIVMVVLAIIGTAVGIRIAPAMVSLDVDVVTTLVADSLSKSRREALGGKGDIQFNLDKALASYHPGISVTSQMPGSANSGGGGGSGGGGKSTKETDRFDVPGPGTGSNSNCQGNCATGQTLCVSGQPFCYSDGKSFNFERYSGRLTDGEARAIFIVSKSRKLALLISRAGTTEIAELINGQWKLRTELQVVPGNGSSGSAGGKGGKGDNPPAGGGSGDGGGKGGGKGGDKLPDPPIVIGGDIGGGKELPPRGGK